ncbi:band 4.1-like protein 4A [Nephila pilipes]|uniref:Band 4.1-like protein 4A n=1 Tax=Nephila pilipes TaxID=299642 RepID=A0A8X6UKI6_NEPPI|nr:band 4.1-like protein 4A [Nephila pilipes]
MDLDSREKAFICAPQRASAPPTALVAESRTSRSKNCFDCSESVNQGHCSDILFPADRNELKATTKGEFLLERVFSHLNLVEKAYFGLRFLNRTGESRWLDPLQKVDKQLKGLSPFTLYFGVKFYASDPCRLLEEITRYQFVLQLKQDIVQGRLPLTDDLAAELFALSLQGGLLLHTILTCIREAFQNARL